jgi:hypothetical protein
MNQNNSDAMRLGLYEEKFILFGVLKLFILCVVSVKCLVGGVVIVTGQLEDCSAKFGRDS